MMGFRKAHHFIILAETVIAFHFADLHFFLKGIKYYFLSIHDYENDVKVE